MAAKCKIKMGDKLAPVPGSVHGVPGKETGTCPACDTPGVMLSIVGGYIRAHVITDQPAPENNPQAGTLVEPPVKIGSELPEPTVDNTDTGTRVGDPFSALKRRTIELEGAYEAGTVKIPVKGEKGRAKLTEVPATEGNVRAALAYWIKKKPRKGQTTVPGQADMVSGLTRRLEAMRQGTPAVEADKHEPVETTGHGRAPVLVRGRAMEPFTGDTATRHVSAPTPAPVAGTLHGPEREHTEVTSEPEVWAGQLDGVLGSGVDDTRKGWSSQTMNGPTGRERSEPERMHGGRGGWLTEAQYNALNRTQQRKYWAKLKRDRDHVDRRVRTRIARLGTGAIGSHGFTSGDSRTTEALMRQKVYSTK